MANRLRRSPTAGGWPAMAAVAAVWLVGAGAALAEDAPAALEAMIERPVLAAPHLLAMSLVKVAIFLVFAAVVFSTCNWALLDIRLVNTDRVTWGGMVLGGAVLGLAAAALIPLFYIGLPLGILLFAGAAGLYATHRNSLVTPPLRVLSGAHLTRIQRRLGGRKGVESESGPVTGAGRDIIFMALDDMPIRLAADSELQRRANQDVERILFEAIRRRVSTAGVLVRPQRAEVRFRIGGDMIGGGDVEGPAAAHVATAFKRLAGLDPNETRKPQEGRLRAVVAGQSIDLRIKTAGTVRGEQIAIRLIDAATAQMRLDDLGLADDALISVTQGLGVRPGLVLVSSPKDSGLTTTLHAILRNYDRYMNNVVAFEPHHDIEVENVTHVAVNQEDGPIAASEVSGRLRMDPDVVSFDSLYQTDVAQALIPHAKEHTLVVGIRAIDTSQAMTRLAALFGSNQPLAERLQLVISQRVVRLLCPECKEAYRPNPEFLRKANLGSRNVDVLYRPPTSAESVKGKPAVCPRCHNDRYAGRRGLFEVMLVDSEVREMIGQGATAADVRNYVRRSGMRNLQEEGLQMVIDGLTSIEEVLRAIKQEA